MSISNGRPTRFPHTSSSRVSITSLYLPAGHRFRFSPNVTPVSVTDLPAHLSTGRPSSSATQIIRSASARSITFDRPNFTWRVLSVVNL